MFKIQKLYLFLALISQLCAPEEMKVLIYASSLAGLIDDGETILELTQRRYRKLVDENGIRREICIALGKKHPEYRSWAILCGTEVKFPREVPDGRLEINLVQGGLVDWSYEKCFAVRQENGLFVKFIHNIDDTYALHRKFCFQSVGADCSRTRIPMCYLRECMKDEVNPMYLTGLIFNDRRANRFLKAYFEDFQIRCTTELMDFIVEHSLDFESKLLSRSVLDTQSLHKNTREVRDIHILTFVYLLSKTINFPVLLTRSPQSFTRREVDLEFLAEFMPGQDLAQLNQNSRLTYDDSAGGFKIISE